jgi:hypothetical protein
LASIGLVEASKRARKKTPRSEVTGVEVTDIYVIQLMLKYPFIEKVGKKKEKN